MPAPCILKLKVEEEICKAVKDMCEMIISNRFQSVFTKVVTNVCANRDRGETHINGDNELLKMVKEIPRCEEGTGKR